jgi:hypothetical protein
MEAGESEGKQVTSDGPSREAEEAVDGAKTGGRGERLAKDWKERRR